MRIAELLTEAEFMEKRRMIEVEAERLHIQEKVAKAQAKFKIYEGIDHMSQKAEKIEVQEDKGNIEHQLRHAQTVADKTNCYNKNQEAPVSFLHQKKSISVKKQILSNFINKKDPILKKECHTNYKKYRNLLSALVKKSKQVYYDIFKEIGIIEEHMERNQIPYISKNCSIQCSNCTLP